MCQVHREVEGELAVAGSEALGLGGLGVPHYADAVVERLEVHYPVVPDLELLAGS